MSRILSPKKSPDEWFRLITECRQSGLSDTEWCRIKSIPRSTFSEAVKRLRKMSYAIPDRMLEGNPLDLTSKQEVIRIGIMQDSVPAPYDEALPAMKPAPASSTDLDNSHTIEVQIGNAEVRLSNNANPNLVMLLMHSLLKGGHYAC